MKGIYQSLNKQLPLIVQQLQKIADSLNIDIATLFQLIQEGRDLGLNLDASTVEGFKVFSSSFDTDYLPKVESNVLKMNLSTNTILQLGNISPIPSGFDDPYQGLWLSHITSTDNSKTESYTKLGSIDPLGKSPYVEITQNLSLSRNAFVKGQLIGNNLTNTGTYRGYYLGGKDRSPFASPMEYGRFEIVARGRFYDNGTLPHLRPSLQTISFTNSYNSKGISNTFEIEFSTLKEDYAYLEVYNGLFWFHIETANDSKRLEVTLEFTALGEYT